VAVQAMGKNSFILTNGIQCDGHLLIVNGRAFKWTLPSSSSSSSSSPSSSTAASIYAPIDLESLRVFKNVLPRPDILVIGTGAQARPLDPKVKQYLNGLGIQVEICNTRRACAAFSLLVDEDRRVSCAILAP
ncbi:hypothetical protein GQ42DRAFT_115652, partial [Ramicandelaber brevisporus]